MATYYYIECDGQVYLEERDGQLTLPTAVDHLGFGVQVLRTFPVGADEVHFCKPDLKEQPAEWLLKDEAAALPTVSEVVRRAVNATFPRLVAGAVIRHGNEVLLVRASRGFTKGLWNVPGGFVEYGESPEECLRREVHEELGIDIAIERLLTVETKKFRSPYYMLSFVYEASAADGAVHPNPDEIAEARWMSLAEAARVADNPFARKGLEILLSKDGAK